MRIHIGDDILPCMTYKIFGSVPEPSLTAVSALLSVLDSPGLLESLDDDGAAIHFGHIPSEEIKNTLAHVVVWAVRSGMIRGIADARDCTGPDGVQRLELLIEPGFGPRAVLNMLRQVVLQTGDRDDEGR